MEFKHKIKCIASISKFQISNFKFRISNFNLQSPISNLESPIQINPIKILSLHFEITLWT